MMSNISLRWRITILMGVLVLTASGLLTILSIHNATDNFVIPLTKSEISIDDTGTTDGSEIMLPFGDSPQAWPENIYYAPEINVEDARQSFSALSILYLALITAGSMIAAYCLAGHAMRPILKLNKEIELIDGRTLSKRVAVPQTKDEMERLSLSFNQLLERLEREFEREKQFSANAAHELKTPLTTIMTSAQVLKLNDRTTAEEYREYLDITLQNVRRLSDVLDGLLALSKSDARAAYQSVNIVPLLQEIEQELEPRYREKKLSLVYDLQAEVIMGDRLLLHQAFFNLIENAYKYTEKNGSILIAACCTDTETIIRISDNGIGIPEDDLNRIFQPFYRADKSRSRKIAGAGLGLSIVKEIFDLHDAAITIANQQEGGTIVEVRFQFCR